MASLFPAPGGSNWHPPIISQDAPICGMIYVAMKLGREDLGPRRMVRYVQNLVNSFGFPKPFPAPRGKSLITDVIDVSRWSRDAVDIWCHDWLPPEAALAVDAASLAAAGAEMDAAATNLKLISGGRS